MTLIVAFGVVGMNCMSIVGRNAMGFSQPAKIAGSVRTCSDCYSFQYRFEQWAGCACCAFGADFLMVKQSNKAWIVVLAV